MAYETEGALAKKRPRPGRKGRRNDSCPLSVHHVLCPACSHVSDRLPGSFPVSLQRILEARP